MNNLRIFATYADYSAATLNYPAVSWVVSGDTVYFDKAAPVPTCEPTNPNEWVSADPNDFDFSQKVYAISLDIVSNLGEGNTLEVYLYNSPNDGTWTYMVSVTYMADHDSEIYYYELYIYDSSMHIVYSDTSGSGSAEFDLCNILGSGFYLKSADVPSVEVCDQSECTEYECVNWDEETGECIEQGECINSECVESHQEYPSVVV